VLPREQRVDRREADVLVRPHVAGLDSRARGCHECAHQVHVRRHARVAACVRAGQVAQSGWRTLLPLPSSVRVGGAPKALAPAATASAAIATATILRIPAPFVCETNGPRVVARLVYPGTIGSKRG
jgi:hypothetical protein